MIFISRLSDFLERCKRMILEVWALPSRNSGRNLLEQNGWYLYLSTKLGLRNLGLKFVALSFSIHTVNVTPFVLLSISTL